MGVMLKMNRNIDKLETLQQLKDKGTITEEKFNIEKQNIVNSNKQVDVNNGNSYCTIGFILSLLTAIIYETPLKYADTIGNIWSIFCFIALVVTIIGLLKIRNRKKDIVFVVGIVSLMLSGLQVIWILQWLVIYGYNSWKIKRLYGV